MKNKRSKIDEERHHLILLAKNNAGYKILLKLVSIAYLEGFYYKPRIDEELLHKYSGGLIALSGCLGEKVPRCIESGDIQLAGKAIQEYIDIFGKENFYLELTDFGIKKQKDINRTMHEIAGKFGIGVVCTNDVHYLKREDFKYHFLLLCIQAGSTMGDFKKYCEDLGCAPVTDRVEYLNHDPQRPYACSTQAAIWRTSILSDLAHRFQDHNIDDFEIQACRFLAGTMCDHAQANMKPPTNALTEPMADKLDNKLDWVIPYHNLWHRGQPNPRHLEWMNSQ